MEERRIGGEREGKKKRLTPSNKKLKPSLQAIVGGVLTRPSPVTVTAANQSFPPQLHGWAPPNKNTTLSTLGALGRGVGSVANSSNPLNATKAITQGLALYKRETAALLKGQSGVVTYASSSVAASSLAASDLKCFVDPVTGQLVGLEQAGSVACSPASSSVVVPFATAAAPGAYISQIKLAYTYDGAFVGRLVFEVKANATAKPVSYTCGSAGGKAVDLLPNNVDFAVTKLSVGCAPLKAINGRRLRAAAVTTSGPGLGLSAGTFGAVATSLALLPADPVTGAPLTQSVGDVLVPGGTPGPSPPPPPTTAPTVSQSVAPQLINSDTLVITGTGFDASSPANNVVVLSDGAVGFVTAATATTLTVTLIRLPKNEGPLTAVVSTGLGSSGAPVQVVDVVFPASGLPASYSWRSVATSDDGFNMVACAATGNVWLSSDRGATWVANAGATGLPASDVYTSVAMSGDGTKILTGSNAAGTGKLFLSTDSGVTWLEQTAFTVAPTATTWNAFAMSSSGGVLAAATDGATSGELYLSGDLGTTWVKQDCGLPTFARYTSLTVSDDGLNIAAATYATTGDIFYTTNGGAAWTAATGSPTGASSRWQGVASSTDGAKVLAGNAALAGGDLWLSSDSGTTFAGQTAGLAVPTVWRAVAADPNFIKLAAVVQSAGGVYLSPDSGASFSLATGGGLPTAASWRGVAVSSDGNILAVVGTNEVWVTYDGGATWYKR